MEAPEKNATNGLEKLKALIEQLREPKKKPEKLPKISKATKIHSSDDSILGHSWTTTARFISIRTQKCSCCSSEHQFIDGEWFFQKSRKVTRSIRRGHSDLEPEAFLLPKQLWLHDQEFTEVCPSCLGLEADPAVDSLLDSLDHMLLQSKQKALGI